MSASGAPCWFAMLEPAAAFAHHGSPKVGPRPGDTVVPSKGATAPAGAATTSAAAASEPATSAFAAVQNDPCMGLLLAERRAAGPPQVPLSWGWWGRPRA